MTYRKVTPVAVQVDGVWRPVTAGGSPTPGPAAPTLTGPLDYVPSTSSILLTWPDATPPAGGSVDHYQVRMNGSIVANPPGVSLNVTGLTPATGYVFAYRALSDQGVPSDWSADLVATTKSLPATGGMRWGYWSKPLSGESLTQAFNRVKGQLGTPRVFRYYYGNDALTWPVQGSLFSGIPLFTSHKPYAQGFPIDTIIAGGYDATLDAWARKLPTTYPTYACAMDHENNVKVTNGTYTLAKGAAAWNRCAAVLKAVGNPMIRVCINFSEFSGTNGRGQLAPWAAAIDQDLLDVVTIDQYQNADGLTVAKGRARALPGLEECLLRYPGKKLGIGEVGIVSTYGTDAQKAAWSQGVTAVYNEHAADMEPVAYFSGTGSLGDHILDDYPLTAAVWRAAAGN